MLFLDTADGTAGAAGREAIRSHAAAASQSHEELLVFMHHPPAVTGCTSLDVAVPLADRDETAAVLESLSGEFHVFCGHFHTSGSSRCGNGWVHRTGAVSFTVPCDAQTFRLEHSRPCLRVIEIADGTVSTEHIELT
jgi:Icc protein